MVDDYVARAGKTGKSLGYRAVEEVELVEQQRQVGAELGHGPAFPERGQHGCQVPCCVALKYASDHRAAAGSSMRHPAKLILQNDRNGPSKPGNSRGHSYVTSPSLVKQALKR